MKRRRVGLHNVGVLGLGELGGGVPGLVRILWDQYPDALAAGSVNGTLAIPGPGTRSVNDSGNNLDLTGGRAVANGIVERETRE